MGNTNQAIKRARQADARRDHASQQRSRLRTEIRKYIAGLTKDSDRSSLSPVQGHLDRAAQKGLIPRNRAARIIQRLNARLKRATA